MPSPDVVSWNDILGGYVVHQFSKEALKQFEQMCEEVALWYHLWLSSMKQLDRRQASTTYSHAGLVDEGMCCYLQQLQFTRIMENWNIAAAWLTFLAMLAILAIYNK